MQTNKTTILSLCARNANFACCAICSFRGAIFAFQFPLTAAKRTPKNCSLFARATRHTNVRNSNIAKHSSKARASSRCLCVRYSSVGKPFARYACQSHALATVWPSQLVVRSLRFEFCQTPVVNTQEARQLSVLTDNTLITQRWPAQRHSQILQRSNALTTLRATTITKNNTFMPTKRTNIKCSPLANNKKHCGDNENENENTLGKPLAILTRASSSQAIAVARRKLAPVKQTTSY